MMENMQEKFSESELARERERNNRLRLEYEKMKAEAYDRLYDWRRPPPFIIGVQQLLAEYERQITESNRRLRDLEAETRWAVFLAHYHGPKQRKIMRVLHEADLRGETETAGMHERLVVERAQIADGRRGYFPRLCDMFKHNRYWKKDVEKTEPGYYRLREK
jgi:hypothetical protein